MFQVHGCWSLWGEWRHLVGSYLKEHRTMPTAPPRRRNTAALLAAILLAAFAGVVSVVALTATPARAATTLDQLAKAKGKLFFGSATDNPELSDTAYTSILGSEWGSITPGNSQKWDTTEPSNGTFNFGPGDTVVNFAKAHNEVVRGHNLVWHSQLPGWVSSLPTNQVQAAMETHITTEVNHYKGQVYSWDVVNEPFNDDGTYRTDAFYNAMGTGYIADALRTARAADPNAKLYLNDYNLEGSGAKADAMFNLVSSLKSQGVPIDAVGFEGHLATQYGFPSGLQANLQRFANLGVDVAITELDVRMPLPETAAQDATQTTYYTNVVNACLAVSRCVSITVWDFTDKYSWVPGAFSGQGAACLYDSNLTKKPVYNAVANALGGTVSPTTSPTSPPPTSPPPTGSGTCHVLYAVQNQWNTGFTTQVTIGNTGSAALSGWTLKWTFPSGQTVTSGWNGSFSQSGAAVTVTNLSYNGAIAPGGSTSIGFNGNWSGSNTSPTSFTLNGVSCS
jgi:endo-1,4-beta-xylanase